MASSSSALKTPAEQKGYLKKITIARSQDAFDDSEATARDVVVVDGQAYYRSSGKYSKEEGRWFPFAMIVGNTKLFSVEDLPLEYSARYVTAYESQPKMYIVKQFANFYDHTRFAKIRPHDVHYEVKQVEQNQLTKLENLKNRLGTKSCAIISCRLSGGSDKPEDGGYSDGELRELGLTDDEIQQARQPLLVNPEPEKTINDPDEVNQWLIQEKAALPLALLRLTQKYPKSLQLAKEDWLKFEEIWNKTSESKEGDRNINKAYAILQSYNEKNWLGVFRHHRSEVKKAKDAKLNTIDELLVSLSQIKRKEMGSLDKRLLYIAIKNDAARGFEKRKTKLDQQLAKILPKKKRK